MKIALYNFPAIELKRRSIKDSRLDQLHKLSGSKNKTYFELDLSGPDAAKEADAIILTSAARQDLLLLDLEFVDNRLQRSEDAAEKELLKKLKGYLESESFIFDSGISQEEQKALSGYDLLTKKPAIVVSDPALREADEFFLAACAQCGWISFFTSNEKETRAWLIKKGTSAWEAAGLVHSDIQRGFIRAEVIACSDFIQAGGFTQAKQAGKMRLEGKDYIVQDADIINFRFNK